MKRLLVTLLLILSCQEGPYGVEFCDNGTSASLCLEAVDACSRLDERYSECGVSNKYGFENCVNYVELNPHDVPRIECLSESACEDLNDLYLTCQ